MLPIPTTPTVLPYRLLPMTVVARLTSPVRAGSEDKDGQRRSLPNQATARRTSSVKLANPTAERQSETKGEFGDAESEARDDCQQETGRRAREGRNSRLGVDSRRVADGDTLLSAGDEVDRVDCKVELKRWGT